MHVGLTEGQVFNSVASYMRLFGIVLAMTSLFLFQFGITYAAAYTACALEPLAGSVPECCQKHVQPTKTSDDCKEMCELGQEDSQTTKQVDLKVYQRNISSDVIVKTTPSALIKAEHPPRALPENSTYSGSEIFLLNVSFLI